MFGGAASAAAPPISQQPTDATTKNSDRIDTLPGFSTAVYSTRIFSAQTSFLSSRANMHFRRTPEGSRRLTARRPWPSVPKWAYGVSPDSRAETPLPMIILLGSYVEYECANMNSQAVRRHDGCRRLCSNRPGSEVGDRTSTALAADHHDDIPKKPRRYLVKTRPKPGWQRQGG